MGNATAIKGMDMAVQAASAKLAGGRQTGQADDGFQKLLNSKAEEDAGAKQSTGAKKEDSKEIVKEEAPKKPEAEEKPEETKISVDTALEQAQAALLFQMTPETYVEEEALTAMPEEGQELMAEIGELIVEQPVQTVKEEALPQPEQKPLMLPEVQEEAIATELEPEKVVVPTEAKEEKPETRADSGKPKEAVKPVVQEEAKVEPKAEQLAESVQADTHEAERTPVSREVPTEYVRVRQPEEIPEKVLDQLLVKTMAGIKEFEIQLEPYELGKILIKVAFGKDSTNVSILCTEPKTMELMAKNARELGAIMEENLGSPTTIVVEDKETSYLEQQNQGNSGNQGQSQEEEQQKRNQQNQQNEGVDFLQQLRLGLI